MKRIYTLLTFSLIAFALRAETPALERTVTINFQNEVISEALKKIGQQADVTFSYGASAFDPTKRVTKAFVRRTIREIIDELFEGTVKGKAKSSYIILTRNEKHTVSGYVEDAPTGEKLRQVTVYDPVSLRSAITDEFGYFEIEIKKPTADDIKLVIKREDYAPTEATVSRNKRRLQKIDIQPDKQNWKKFTDSLDSKVDRMWQWTKNKVVSINKKNVRDTLHRFGQVSFVPFVGTNHKMSGHVVNGYSFNVLGGFSAGTDRAELGGLFNMDRGDVRFAQVAGLFNANGGNMTGVQVGGIFNSNFKDTQGAQVGGIFNMNLGKTTGIQVGGIFNTNLDSVSAIQVAGLFNVNGRATEGVQLAGLFNSNFGETKGAQVAGLINMSTKSVTGVQVAGLINIAPQVTGSQIGFINIADTVQGVPIGFLSFVKRGYHKIEISADEIFPANISFRTGVHQFHNIFTAGVMPKNDSVTWIIGYGVGSLFKISKRWHLNTDITSYQVGRNNFDYLNMIHKLFVGLDFMLGKKVSVVAGATLNLHTYDTDAIDPKALFNYYTPDLLSKGTFSGNTSYQMWLGAKIGFRFL